MFSVVIGCFGLLLDVSVLSVVLGSSCLFVCFRFFQVVKICAQISQLDVQVVF